jgi:multicomponent Na+:H+ antiporter subunit F
MVPQGWRAARWIAAVRRWKGFSVLAVAIIAFLVTATLALVRATLGPTIFDRLQAANTVGTCAMLLLAALGFLDGRPEFLDLALTYGLLNVIGVFAVLKFLRQGDLGEADSSPGKGRGEP